MVFIQTKKILFFSLNRKTNIIIYTYLRTIQHNNIYTGRSAPPAPVGKMSHIFSCGRCRRFLCLASVTFIYKDDFFIFFIIKTKASL